MIKGLIIFPVLAFAFTPPANTGTSLVSAFTVTFPATRAEPSRCAFVSPDSTATAMLTASLPSSPAIALAPLLTVSKVSAFTARLPPTVRRPVGVTIASDVELTTLTAKAAAQSLIASDGRAVTAVLFVALEWMLTSESAVIVPATSTRAVVSMMATPRAMPMLYGFALA